MKIDEAIGRLEQHKHYLESLNAQEQVEAHQLGIEALKREQRLRQMVRDDQITLLPRETEGD